MRRTPLGISRKTPKRRTRRGATRNTKACARVPRLSGASAVRLAAALIGLAVLAGAAPAQAQETIWSGTLNVVTLESGNRVGCDNDATSDSRRCLNSNNLSNDSFSANDVTYYLYEISLDSYGELRLHIVPALRSNIRGLTFHVGDTAFQLRFADDAEDLGLLSWRGWDDSGLSWSAGDSVSLKLTVPSSTGASIISTPRFDNTYLRGEHIEVAVDFSEVVTVSGSPQLVLALGDDPANLAEKAAAYHRGSRTARLVFRYTVERSNTDTTGINLYSNPLRLNGGTIQVDHTIVRRGLPDWMTLQPTQNIDGTVAYPVGAYIISTPRFLNSYIRDEHIVVAVDFIGAVTVRGSPQLFLALGDDPANLAENAAAFLRGSGTSQLVFRYALQGSVKDTTGINLYSNPLRLNGGTVQEGSTDAKITTLPEWLALTPTQYANGARTDAACAAPDLTGKRQVWVGTVAVGESGSHHGWRDADSVGNLANTTFRIGSTDYEIASTYVNSGEAGVANDSSFQFELKTILSSGHRAALTLYACNAAYALSSAQRVETSSTYVWEDTNLDWSTVATRTLYLAVRHNTAATGKPAISGTATVGSTLTAARGTIVDTDGVPAESTFTYQWIRVDGSSEIAISGATSSTYTLVGVDAGKKLRVRVSFTDDLGSEEARTSNVYPPSVPGAPQNLAVSAGDALAILTWGAPASDGGADITEYEYRHAAAATVPDSATWTDVPDSYDVGASTADESGVTISGLANGTQYAFEVRAVNSVGGGAKAGPVTATPMAIACAAPNFGARRNIWTGDLKVGTVAVVGTAFAHGFAGTVGGLDDKDFTIGSNDYEIDAATVISIGADAGDLRVSLKDSDLTTVERATLRLHVCNAAYDFSAASPPDTDHTYGWTDDLDWSSGLSSRTLHLSLPANNAATGKPTITGAAEVGQTLIAATSGIEDADGLPSSFSYQWVRVDGGTETDISGATSSTYTLAAADAGKKFKVRVSFTDDLGSEEERTSDVYPLTVPGAPRNLEATAGEMRVTLTWTAPASDGGAAITEYEYRHAAASAVPDGMAWTDVPDGSDAGGSTADETGATISGLTNGTQYAFEVRAVNNVGGGAKAGPVTATPTVDGPRATLRLSLSSASVAEGETATATATVDPPHDVAFTAMVSGTPEGRFEFVGGNRTLSFAAAATASTGTVTIRAKGNDVDDGDAEIEVSAAPSSTDVGAGATVTLTIRDDDLPKVSIAAPVWQWNTGHVYEAEAADHNAPGDGRFWLTREGLTDAALDVTVRPSESGGDFVSPTVQDTDRTVTFAIGETMVSFGPVTSDTDPESHGTVTATLQSGAGYDIKSTAAATANLRDDDGALLTVTVGLADLSVPEGQPAQFHALGATVRDGTFSAAGDLNRVFGATGLAVNAATAAGSATAGTDFTALGTSASAMLVYADATVAGSGVTVGLELAADLPAIATTEDTTDDPDETFTVTVSLPSRVDMRIGLGTPSTATATIREGPVVTLVLNDAELTEGETATVTATVDPMHDAGFTVTVATDPASSERFAFVGSNRTLAFAADAGSSTRSVRIRATANTVDDGDLDDLEVTGSATVADIKVEAAMFKVLDNDDPTVSVTAPSAVRAGFMYEGEAGSAMDENDDGSGAWTVTRDGDAPDELEVKVRVSESSPGNRDFVAAADEGERTVTLAAGETSASVYAVTDDTTDEAHGTATVTVVAGSGYAVSSSHGSASAEVRDDDGTLLTLTVDPAALEVTEGTNAKLYAVATAVDDGTFTSKEDVARLFGTTGTTATAASANGTATAPADYAALPSNTTVSLRYADLAGAPLAVRAALPEIATVREETMGDAGETFTVTVAKASTETDMRIVAGTPATATVTLFEGPPDGKLRMCSRGGTCVEQDGKWSVCGSDGTCEEQSTGRDVPLEGRLEIAYNGEWGTVCDDYWTETDAAVACRRLGRAGEVEALVGSPFGGAARDVPVWLDDVQCTGDESDLLACPRNGGVAVGAHNCKIRPRHEEDAGVRCAATTDAAQGHLIFRSPDGAEHDRNASMPVAAGAIARYGIRLSTKPVVLRDGYGQLYVEIDGATDRVLTYPERHVWAAPDTSDPDDDRWTETREVTVSVSPNASGEVVLAHTADRRGHPDHKFTDTYRMTVTVERARAGRPGAPVALSAEVQDVHVVAEWEPPSDAGTAPLEGYRLESRAGSGGWNEIVAKEPDDTYHYDLDALEEVGSRDYRVAAANEHGAGPYTAAVTATKPAPSAAAEGAVHLAGGSVPWEGAVTVFGAGVWSAVCGTGWDLGDAHAACRRTGYAGALQAYTHAASGTACGSGRIAGAVCAPPVGTETGAPRLTGASADGELVTLRFDAPLDGTFAPAPRDFLMLSGGSDAASRCDHPVLTVALAGSAVELRVASPLGPGAAVGVGYLRPALHPLRGAVGGAAVAAFEDAAVRNPADNARQAALKETEGRAPVAAGPSGPSAPSTRSATSPVPLEREAGLAAAIAAALADGAEPWSLVTLDASGRRIADLAGIGSLTALEELNLAGNALGDVRALAALPNLRVLDLSGNRVADLWPLAGLSDLERLALAGNRIGDATPLAGLGRLRVLDLSRNAVTDLAAIGGLDTLEYLALADNGLWNADRLGTLRSLVRLDLADNALADVGALSDLRNVVWLRLSGNRVARVEGLGRLVRLRWVWLADNPLVRAPGAYLDGPVWCD